MSAVYTLAAEESGGDSKIEVGHHIPFSIGGLEFNLDTIIGTGVAAIILLGLAFYLRAKVTAGVPNGVQLFFETVVNQMRSQIESAIGMRVAPFVLPLAVGLFTFILISNWLSVIPAQYGTSEGTASEWLKPPASDVNFVYALAVVVFVWYHAAGVKRRGFLGYPKKLVKGHVVFLAPINIIEEIAKPVSLSLRLFGNIFAGGIMIALITLFPAYIAWAPNAIWKLFDLFVGLIQAFIFALLTILYFSQSMESEDAH
ncbi:F0F1 ATP synthase subunit A [Williamsia serinedens]|uniref:ATP synthase subunit a n=1 Tax=Williamsia serinedens TaxID=391736 RepID=A0ABT1H8F4_9NOCA|nr:F0F1 ATP synthase subunit A [Williamsia serinedens]MCP2162888.1 F-type H+-transporting ATPase subunit a [Williamsia serinedens]